MMGTLEERMCGVPRAKMLEYLELKMAYDLLPPEQKAYADMYLASIGKRKKE